MNGNGGPEVCGDCIVPNINDLVKRGKSSAMYTKHMKGEN